MFSVEVIHLRVLLKLPSAIAVPVKLEILGPCLAKSTLGRIRANAARDIGLTWGIYMARREQLIGASIHFNSWSIAAVNRIVEEAWCK